MNNADKAKVIMSLITKAKEAAVSDYLAACGQHGFLRSARAAWDQEHPYDGVGSISGNPYTQAKEDAAWKAVTSRQEQVSNWNEVYKYALDKFLDMVP